jgi:lysozyme family protein
MMDLWLMSTFDVACNLVLAEEGGWSADPEDPGNWTGGKCGQGQLRGTKFGICSRSYPAIDISNLTRADAEVIYRRDYWDKIQGDKLPPQIALMVFDCAVNQGLGAAIGILQTALGVPPDGQLGPVTLAAANSKAPIALLTEIASLRAVRYAHNQNVVKYGLGWYRRLMRVFVESVSI